MKKVLTFVKNFLLDLFFPQFCISCGGEGSYLCQDCLSLINFSENLYCPFCHPPKISFSGETCGTCQKRGKKLKGLFFSAPYQNFIIKKVIAQFKYEPYLKALAKTLASFILHHLQSIEKSSFSNLITERAGQAVLIPVPLTKKKLKQRGFNQAEEIAKELSQLLAIPLLCDILIKIKETLAQVDLSRKERQENIKGAFCCKKSDEVKGRIIFLVDDVFTTGSTMEECARLLKEDGAKEVWGIAAARE